MKRVFSGIQPTGLLTIGNYLGAIKNWVEIQKDAECIYCIVDLHAITTLQEPKALKQACINNLALYIASGIDPKKSTIFIQSTIAYHTELSWILNCITPLGWLKRMTQFKDKSAKNKDAEKNIHLGLLAYPTLMAADILLYHTDLVPVGEDQTQHVEFVRDIAAAFNRLYDIQYFKLPQAITPKQGARIMSLKDASKKMSKSDPSDLTRINMLDSPDLIAQKIKKATTDAFSGITYDEVSRPEITNLLNIFSSFNNISIEELVARYQNVSTSIFKSDLVEAIVNKLSPIQAEFAKLTKEEYYLQQLVNDGSYKANEIAANTIKQIKNIVGLS